MTLNGSLPLLKVDDWLALSRSGTGGGNAATPGGDWSGVFAGADLDVAEFSVFGQQLGSTRVSARRRTDDWQFELDSDAIAGHVARADGLARRAAGRRRHAAAVPERRRRLGRRAACAISIRASCRGCSCMPTSSASASGRSGASTPRSWPIRWGFGSSRSRARPTASRRKAAAAGSWATKATRRDSRSASTRRTSARCSAQLGFAPFVEAETAEVTASVFWPGPPSGAWLDHISGDLALRAAEGQPRRRRARRRRPRRGALEHQRAAAPARARFPRRVQPRPRVRRDHGRLRRRRRQRLHGQPEAHGTRGRGRSHRPHGAARPRLPPAGRRHGGARQGAADGRRAARRPAGGRRAADLHAHLQEAAWAASAARRIA